jgi:hypothetical protein
VTARQVRCAALGENPHALGSICCLARGDAAAPRRPPWPPQPDYRACGQVKRTPRTPDLLPGFRCRSCRMRLGGSCTGSRRGMIAAKDQASQYCGNTQSNEGSQHILTDSAQAATSSHVLRSPTRMRRVSLRLKSWLVQLNWKPGRWEPFDYECSTRCLHERHLAGR